jgi:ribosomal protein L13E
VKAKILGLQEDIEEKTKAIENLEQEVKRAKEINCEQVEQ